MADWSLIGGAQAVEAAGADLSTTNGTAITAGGTANTKGSWTQLIASTGVAAVNGFWLSFWQYTPSDDFLLDIGIGPAAGEEVILSNLFLAGSHQGAGISVFFPLALPAGTRLAARAQCATASAIIYIMAHLMQGSLLTGAPLQLCTTYGANAADSGGTPVDPGTTVNTKGSYVQIAASMSRAARALLIATGRPIATDYTRWFLDVAVGAGGAEQVVLPNLFVGAPQNFGGAPNLPDTFPAILGPYPANIPAGSRLSVRAQSDKNSGDRILDVVVYGLE